MEKPSINRPFSMATLNNQRVNGDIDVPNSHWLVEKNRGVSSETPEKQQVCLMVGILVGALEHDFYVPIYLE